LGDLKEPACVCGGCGDLWVLNHSSLAREVREADLSMDVYVSFPHCRIWPTCQFSSARYPDKCCEFNGEDSVHQSSPRAVPRASRLGLPAHAILAAGAQRRLDGGVRRYHMGSPAGRRVKQPVITHEAEPGSTVLSCGAHHASVTGHPVEQRLSKAIHHEFGGRSARIFAARCAPQAGFGSRVYLNIREHKHRCCRAGSAAIDARGQRLWQRFYIL